ncbi:male-specific lethal 1 homolog isoform X2 [Agrilus planipennis]|uniref:Male-specific lethal 1 homolog isoform X2 n=1 Tax=Agrilus planipennis TaxID=224129 RepID=A0A1W4W945_AGRPL|nr:male-specific lethal 1 homolog isoform X2 [Agrilus planipennis]
MKSNGASDKEIDLNSSYDHGYASNSGTVLPNLSSSNCQNAESEVKFLREWLLLHLDLIQQQNDEILSKEKTISMLKQENEMLKERLNSFQKGISSHSQRTTESNLDKFITNTDFKITEVSHIVREEKEEIPLLSLSTETNSITVEKADYPEDHKPEENSSSNVNSCTTYYNLPVNNSDSTQVDEKAQKDNFNSSDCSALLNNLTENNKCTDNIPAATSVDVSLKNIRMSIRRKRLCSNSSILSNNDSLEEKNLTRKLRKKRKCSLKNDKLLMCNEQYLTQTGEVNIPLTEPDVYNEFTRPTNLEVPRWRVKVYTSCYTMEGTENLDDEVFNKRHLKHENDERRRKRWDVQRIREQRIVEKLKQRQERVASGSKGEDQSEPVQSLWPLPEDIKYLEVCDQLPVSALGAPLPRFTPSEFSLPWLNNPHLIVRRNSNRRCTGRRKGTKR